MIVCEYLPGLHKTLNEGEWEENFRLMQFEPLFWGIGHYQPVMVNQFSTDTVDLPWYWQLI